MMKFPRTLAAAVAVAMLAACRRPPRLGGTSAGGAQAPAQPLTQQQTTKRC